MKSKPTRRDVLRGLGEVGLASLAGMVGCGTSAGGGRGGRPNILFIMADDHAAHALSCYGSRLNRTPNLDRIAADGVRLANCFCTNSICAPSRAAILTGAYSHVNGVHNNREEFDGSQPTFPQVLRDAGYHTGVVGKWHLKSAPVGFDYWKVLPGQGAYHDPEFIEMGERTKHTGYVTDIITDMALEFMRNRDPARPFCLLYHHKAPHRRWEPDEAHAGLYADEDIPVPATFDDDYAGRGTAAHTAEMRIDQDLQPSDVKADPPEGLTPEELKHWKYQRYIKDYLRVIASIDENVGRVLDYLDESGLAENTLVVYTSDQGFFLGDHGWFDKRFMYEESLRMPLLARLPGVLPRGKVIEDMVLNVDFAPTFLDLAGAAPANTMQGRSALPVLRGRRPKDWRTSFYYQYYEYPGAHSVRKHYGVRTDRYKLIHYYGDLDEWELFDLERDPHELRNVYDDPAYGDVVQRLTTELTRLRAELDVPED